MKARDLRTFEGLIEKRGEIQIELPVETKIDPVRRKKTKSERRAAKKLQY